MPRSPIRKHHPLSMRLPEADIAVIDRAAGLRGRSRTDFIREAAVQAAEATIIDVHAPDGVGVLYATVKRWFGPKTRADSSMTHSDAGVLSTVMKLDPSNEPKKNAFQLVEPACTAAE